MITYRWIDGPTAADADWQRVDDVLVVRGWMALNRELTRILVAEDEGVLAGFAILQLIPHVEPLWVAPSKRGTEVASTLADKMIEYMVEAKARGWIAVASNSQVAKMCEEHGMTRVDKPVYVKVNS
jgi:hypothetical protein